MKHLKSIVFVAVLAFFSQSTAFAQADKATTKFKKYINEVVQNVEKAEQPEQKRAILNDSFDDLISTFDKVASMNGVSEKDREAITRLRSTITDKKNELNGLDGYAGVKNNQLNNFANYVQQDMEQADETITISVTVLLLIIIILLLL